MKLGTIVMVKRKQNGASISEQSAKRVEFTGVSCWKLAEKVTRYIPNGSSQRNGSGATDWVRMLVVDRRVKDDAAAKSSHPIYVFLSGGELLFLFNLTELFVSIMFSFFATRNIKTELAISRRHVRRKNRVQN